MTSPEQNSILDLNDDCFYHIYKFLSILDWCSLRETCTRFRTISDYCFNRTGGTFKLEPPKMITGDYKHMKISEVKLVLRTFGRYMKTLSLNRLYFRYCPNCHPLMLYIDRYCISLVDLKIANLELNLETTKQCSRLFSKLQRLVIVGWEKWNEEAFSDCLLKCKSLTKLDIDSLFYIEGDKLGECRMQFLKSLNLSGSHGFRYEAFKRFITINPQLTQLKLADLFKGCMDSDKILEDIANTLPKLEYLSLQLFTVFMRNASPIKRLTSLKKFEIDLRSIDAVIVIKLLKSVGQLNTIENLHLTSFKCTDESIRLLSSLKSLKILRLSGTSQLSRDMCTRLATGLCGLTEIYISKCRKCNNDSFIEIKEFVLHNPNLKRIAFDIVYDGPLISPNVFLSLAEIRKRQAAKGVLLLFLDDNDINHIQSAYKSNEMEHKLTEHGSILRMSPLDWDMRYIRRINIECESPHHRGKAPVRRCGTRRRFDINILN